MSTPDAPRRDEQVPGDDGFTLLEVVVALALLGVIATAALAFFITGVRTAAELQRRQAAVALASAAVEDARAVVPAMLTDTTGGTSTTFPSLVTGRSPALVTAQWSAASTAELASTYQASDPSATATTTPLVPFTTFDEVSGQDFTTAVLIGTCYRQRSDTTAPCTKPTGVTRTASAPAGYVEMVRVVAQTTWDPGAGRTCSGGACSYTTSVLVDPGTDPEWNTGAGEAVDDVATAQRGRATVLDVLANDTAVPASTSPVTVTMTPTGMTATAGADGRVTLTVPSGAALTTVQLRYTVRTGAGVTTNEAVVRVQVTA